MAFCEKCGAQLSTGENFCSSCGAPVATQSPPQQYQQPPQQQSQPIQQVFDQFNNAPDQTASFAQEDIQANKVMAILSYFSILVLIPIFAAKESAFARFHANQGLIIFLCEIALSVLTTVFSGIGIGFLTTILSLVYLPLTVFAIMGIINAAKGEAKELPLIGGIQIIK